MKNVNTINFELMLFLRPRVGRRHHIFSLSITDYSLLKKMSHGKEFIPLQYFSGWPTILKGNRASKTSGCLVRPFKWRERAIEWRDDKRGGEKVWWLNMDCAGLSSVKVTGRMRRVLTISGILTVINTRHNGAFWHFNKWQRALTAAVKSWTQLKARNAIWAISARVLTAMLRKSLTPPVLFHLFDPSKQCCPFQLPISILSIN